MPKNNHKLVIYHTNKALHACYNRNAAEADKHVAALDKYVGKSPLHQAYRLFIAAMVAQLNHNRSEGEHLLSQAYELFLESGNNAGAGAMLLGRIRISEENLSASVFRECLQLFTRADDRIGMASAWLNTGGYHLEHQDFDKGIQALERAIVLQRENDNLFSEALSHINLAGCYSNKGDFTNALIHAEQSVNLLEALTNGTEEQRFDFLWQTNGWVKVPVKCDTMLANACINYGNTLNALGEQDAALGRYEQARQLMRGVENVIGEAIVVNQIGQVQYERRDFAGAEEFFRQSKRLLDDAGVRGYMYAVVVQGVGEACAEQRKYEEAAIQYEGALAEFVGVEDRKGESEIMILIGELHLHRKQYQKAITSARKGLELAQSISVPGNIVRGLRVLGSAQMHIDSAPAKEYFARALLLAEEHGMKLEEKNVHREMSSYYKLIGDSALALFHYEKYDALKEAIFTAEADKRLKNLHVLHDVEKYKQSLVESQLKIESLENELEQKTRELSAVAMRIMEKEEFVDMVERGLNVILRSMPSEKDERTMELLRQLRSESNVQRDWDEFGRQFTSVYRDYIEKLMKIAPDISPAELKVCVLLRLSMSTKQISDILKLSDRSVDNHRLRIRKKLGLSNRENISTYLIGIESLG